MRGFDRSTAPGHGIARGVFGRFGVPGATLVALVALGACEPPADDVPMDGDPAMDTPEMTAEEARAEVIDSQGEAVGTVSFVPAGPDAVRVEGALDIPELAGGEHGFHIHEVGECAPPDFESAGGHFDPRDTPHGGPDDPPEERHTGDLGNLTFDDEGRADFDFVDVVIQLDGGTDDIRGLAVVIHEGTDDLATQPTGDAGGRAACGVIE